MNSFLSDDGDMMDSKLTIDVTADPVDIVSTPIDTSGHHGEMVFLNAALNNSILLSGYVVPEGKLVGCNNKDWAIVNAVLANALATRKVKSVSLSDSYARLEIDIELMNTSTLITVQKMLQKMLMTRIQLVDIPVNRLRKAELIENIKVSGNNFYLLDSVECTKLSVWSLRKTIDIQNFMKRNVLTIHMERFGTTRIFV